jgi:hypothetical protein
MTVLDEGYGDGWKEGRYRVRGVLRGHSKGGDDELRERDLPFP